MPPKRRGGAAPSSRTSATTTPRKPRQSKLAKENNITAEEETEIKEAFHLFSIKHQHGEFKDEKEGVIRREDVRKTLVALGLPPTDSSELSSILSAVDPTSTGFVPYPPFLSVAAAKLAAKDVEDYDAIEANIDIAFQLFTRGSGGPITLGHLRSIARELKEDDVGEELLKNMILEANGGAGIHAGVTRDEFREVMKRAGVF
ncbi:hypothetical protein MPDQ_008066 [Monascus purpureus]|uniref:EF-hand superfamily Ca2+-modulated protein n=1 Tax=Monascus purpureus TaxID=5098 RepID=A0A507QQQ9_MONPU|nr:hypothetical protein MPDQ_008066 [Monascus purpureus]BDD54881.1 hypothetical protein MAP00_000455 [Monascus purpureus]